MIMFVRLLLIVTLVYYLPGINFSTLTVKGESPQYTSQYINDIINETENGIGGGTYAEGFFPLEILPEFDQDLTEEEYSRFRILTFSSYTLARGDIIGNIAIMTGLNEDTLISVNNISNTRLLQIGQALRIPNQDGIFYTVKAGDTLESIAQTYRTTAAHISISNELFSDTLPPGTRLFIPGARMDWVSRQEINGDLFIWPTAGRISSPYGWRTSPFTRARQYHTGIDISAPPGTPVRAAMAGRVAHVGYDNTFGNFIIINHHSGYRTLYAHLSVVRTRAGSNVGTGERIGDVGSTGLSTGPHLHFTVYKHGATVNPRSLMR